MIEQDDNPQIASHCPKCGDVFTNGETKCPDCEGSLAPVEAENTPESQQYVKDGGCKCPACGSENIVGDGVSLAGTTSAIRVCVCEDCDSDWHEVFELVGIENFANKPAKIKNAGLAAE